MCTYNNINIPQWAFQFGYSVTLSSVRTEKNHRWKAKSKWFLYCHINERHIWLSNTHHKIWGMYAAYPGIQVKRFWGCGSWEQCEGPRWHYVLQEIVSRKRQGPPCKRWNVSQYMLPFFFQKKKTFQGVAFLKIAGYNVKLAYQIMHQPYHAKIRIFT